jgi:phosphohistidine phosphatase SixA
VAVGHEPGLSGVVGALTGGRITLQKGAVAELELDRDDPTSAVLVRLQQPGHLIA